MVTSAYYVTLETRHPCAVDTYADVAGALSNALHATLGDYTKLASLTRAKDLHNAKVEVEVAQSESSETATVIARAIVQVDASDKVAFDKNMFTSMMRAALPFPVSISKRVAADLTAVESPA